MKKSFPWIRIALVSSVLGFAVGALLPSHSVAGNLRQYPNLALVARKSLEKNINQVSTGQYLSAGQHQFRGLWTRDFAFAANGLLAIGRNEVVRDHLFLILRNLREKDGLVPRYLDNASTAVRYMAQPFKIRVPLREPLKPNFAGGSNQGVTIDSNALVILAALNYLDATGDWETWNAMEPDLIRAYRFYGSQLEEGLVKQGAFADWQDSVKRRGFTFFVNVLYWSATQRLVKFPGFTVNQDQADRLRERILARFQDPITGLYSSILGDRTRTGEARISLDGLLLAVDLGLIPYGSREAQLLYEALKRHPLWRVNGRSPGAATWPIYDAKDVEKIPKSFGLVHYHDTIYWSWLMGLAAKVTFRMGDLSESDAILDELERVSLRDGAVAEVYRPEEELPLCNTRIYKAERPFSWGSGLILEALAARSAAAHQETFRQGSLSH